MFNKKSSPAFGLIEALIALVISASLVATTTTTTRMLAQNAQTAQDIVQMNALVKEAIASVQAIDTNNLKPSGAVVYKDVVTDPVKICYIGSSAPTPHCSGTVRVKYGTATAMNSVHNRMTVLHGNTTGGQLIAVRNTVAPSGSSDPYIVSALSPGPVGFGVIDAEANQEYRYYVLAMEITERTVDSLSQIKELEVSVYPLGQADKTINQRTLLTDWK